MDYNQLKSLTDEVLKNLPYPYGPDVETCYSKSASQLVRATIVHESGNFEWNRQVKGPARGWLSMEPPTFQDHKNFLYQHRHDNGWGLFRESMLMKYTNEDRFNIHQLDWNLALNIALCRLHYLRVNNPLPPNKILAHSLYWFSHYNRGDNRKKKIKQFRDNWNEHKEIS